MKTQSLTKIKIQNSKLICSLFLSITVPPSLRHCSTAAKLQANLRSNNSCSKNSKVVFAQIEVLQKARGL